MLLRIICGFALVLSSVVFAQGDTTTTPSEESTKASTSTSTTSQASAITGAQKYVCTQGGKTREIEIVYPSAGTKVPCQVMYKKTDEGATEPQSLWQSQNTEGYCEEKAQGLVSKLAAGENAWSCNPQ